MRLLTDVVELSREQVAVPADQREALSLKAISERHAGNSTL